MFCVAVAHFIVSPFNESFIATEGPSFGFCIPEMFVVLYVLSFVKTNCDTLLNVRNRATTAAALNSGMQRFLMLITFALTGIGSSMSSNNRLSKSSPNVFVFISLLIYVNRLRYWRNPVGKSFWLKKERRICSSSREVSQFQYLHGKCLAAVLGRGRAPGDCHCGVR